MRYRVGCTLCRRWRIPLCTATRCSHAKWSELGQQTSRCFVVGLFVHSKVVLGKIWSSLGQSASQSVFCCMPLRSQKGFAGKILSSLGNQPISPSSLGQSTNQSMFCFMSVRLKQDGTKYTVSTGTIQMSIQMSAVSAHNGKM